jgi:hypothetical protein
MNSPVKKVPAQNDAQDIGWRQFPKFEELLGSETTAPFLAKIEKTCRQLDDMLQSSSEVEKSRAQQAITAYGRSLDLLRLLTEMRDQAGAGK